MNDNFTKTLKHVVLMCTNIIGNNNKFYSIELQSNNEETMFGLYSHYGRISGDEISNGVVDNNKRYSNKNLAEKEFNSVVRKKLKGKKKNANGVDYIEKYEEIKVFSARIGSDNVRNITKLNLNKSLDFSCFDIESQRVLNYFLEENIHEITNSTGVSFKNGNLESPLGILNLEHLKKAKNELTTISFLIDELSYDKNLFLNLNNKYFSLIPRKLGSKISENITLDTKEKIMRELELINNMESTIELSLKNNKDNFNVNELFNIKKIENNEFANLKKMLDKTRKHTNLNSLQIKNIFEVESFKERERFEKKADELKSVYHSLPKNCIFDFEEIDTFHGTKNANILSILLKGFYVPPETASFSTGRMFGNGVYCADSITKSLNYSTGSWSSSHKNKNKSYFVFITRIAMGKVHETNKKLLKGTPKGYNSIFAKGGYDLINNEYIIDNPEQATITYMVEFQ